MTELKFTLEFGECHGYMAVACYANDMLIAEPAPTSSNNVIVYTDVDLPLDLTIKVSGKNLNTDTVVENNKIVKDKYVKLKDVYLAKYPVNPTVMYNLCSFTHSNGNTEQTNYFYRDGTAILKFQATDALRWHLLHNKY